MTRNALKLLAMLSMTADHAALALLDPEPLYVTLRAFGRLAMPIFVCLLADGISQTKNLRRYALRVIIAGAAAEPALDFLRTGNFIDFRVQGVGLTLVCAMAAAISASKIMQHAGEAGEILALSASIAIGFAAAAAHVSYATSAPVIAAAWVVYREKPWALAAMTAGVLMLEAIATTEIQALAIVALPALLYSKAGTGLKKTWRIACYAYFPAHLFVLVAVRIFFLADTL